MRNGIRASIVWAALAVGWFSDSKADNFVGDNNMRWLWNTTNTELYCSLNDSNIINSHWDKEQEILMSIDSKVVMDAALSYFDEEVKLYSLKWEARENVKAILENYLSSHPILKQNLEWKVVFLIDNKSEFASMIKNLANTLFAGMPKVIRDIAVFIAFGWNEELQKTLSDLRSTVYNLPSKQYKDIVFDYFWWILKRVCDKVQWKMTIGEFYDKVNRYYPNKNHEQILEEIKASGQINHDIKDLKYPFKILKKSSKDSGN